MAATFALAAASYYLVERPVMEGVFWRTRAGRRPGAGRPGGDGGRGGGRHHGHGHGGGPSGPAVAARATLPPDGARPAGVGRGLLPAIRCGSSLLGDSLAITLSVGLAVGSVPAYGVQVIDQGVFGCDYDTSPAISAGVRTVPLQRLPAVAHPVRRPTSPAPTPTWWAC